MDCLTHNIYNNPEFVTIIYCLWILKNLIAFFWKLKITEYGNPRLMYYYFIVFSILENLHNLVINRKGYCINFAWDALMHNAEAERTNTINKLQLQIWTSFDFNNSSTNNFIALENQAFRICNFNYRFTKVIYSVVSYDKSINEKPVVKDRSESVTVNMTQTYRLQSK